MNYLLKAPLDVQIELTTDCNQRCFYCYNYWRQTKTAERNSSLGTKELSHILEELRKKEVLSVTLTGGEPFLYPEKVFKCLELAEKVGMQADVNSNLSLLNKPELDFFTRFNHTSVLTSVFSYRQEAHDEAVNSRGSFERITKNIEECVKRNVKVSVNMVLTQRNKGDIYKTAELVKKLGVTTFSATRSIPPVNSKNSHDYCLSPAQLKTSLGDLLEIETRLGMKIEILNCYPKCIMIGSAAYHKFMHRICVAGQTTLTIGATGDVRPCSHSDMIYGNILTDDLSKIWPRMSEWRNLSLLPDFCKGKCELQNICGGGCRVLAQNHGNIKGIDPDAEIDKVTHFGCFFKDEQTKKLPLAEENYGDLLFQLNIGCIFREETFGGIVYIERTRNMVAVNKSVYEYLRKCSSEKYFLSLKNFLESSKAKTEDEKRMVKRLFFKLTLKKILVPIQP